MNLCDRWLNKDIKEHLRFLNFQSAEQIRDETLHFLRGIPRNCFVDRLKQLEKQCHDVIKCNGGYVL
jgi:hypothetical protein